MFVSVRQKKQTTKKQQQQTNKKKRTGSFSFTDEGYLEIF